MAGKGGGGEVVGQVIVEIVGDAEKLSQQIQEEGQNLEGTTTGATGGRKAARDVARPGKDAAPTVTNVDAKVKTKVEGQVAKDIQAAIDTTEYELTLDTASIRKQIEVALQRAFDITVNVKTGEGASAEALSTLGTTHGAAVQAGAPVARGTPPPELSQAMPEHTKNAITNVYRNLNELLTKANKPKFGAFATGPGNEVEKALELMDQFGDQFQDMLGVDWTSKRGKTVTGGTMTPEALAEAFGVDPNDPTMASLQSNLRGLALPAEGGQSPTRGSDVFFAQARAWAGTPQAQVVQPAAAQEQVVKPVVQAAAETAARTVTPDVDERIAQSEEESRKTRQAMSSQAWPSAEEERTAGLRTRPFDLPAGYVGLNAPLGRPAHALRPQDLEADVAAQRALGGEERANPRRFSQRVPVEAVAGIPTNLEPLLRLAAMGRYSRVFEEFGGKGNKESLGRVQFEEPQSAVELEELNRLRAPSKNPNVKRLSGGRMFTPIKPREAFREDVVQMLGVGEDTASLEAIDEFLARPEVKLQIDKQLAVGNNPRRAARSTGTPGGPSAATKRGQGGTGYAGIGTGADLGKDAMSVINWIDDLEGRIANTSEVMASLADDIERSSGTGQDVTGLEAQHRDLAKNLQRMKRQRTEALAQREEIFAPRTPGQARDLAESGRINDEKRRANIEGNKGLSEAEVGAKEFKSPEKTGSRQADLLASMGLSGTDVLKNMLTQRFLAQPSRVRAGTGKDISTGEEEKGRILTGTTALRETAFGSGKRKEGGVFGELVGMLPEDLGRNAKKEAKQAIRDLLEGQIQEEGFQRELLDKDLQAKEQMSGPRKFMGDVGPKEARERGYTGEGQFRFAPGQEAALGVDITRQEEKVAALRAKAAAGTPRKPRGRPETDAARRTRLATVETATREADLAEFGGMDVEGKPVTGLVQMREQQTQSLARKGLEAGEATTAESTRARTQGRGRYTTGEESQALAAERNITMEEPEAPPLPFAAISAEFGGERASAAGGGAGGRPPRGRPPGFDEQEPPEPPEGGPGFPAGGGGAINVFVTNWPPGIGGGAGAGPDVRQQEIVGASRQIAELGAQTSAEFQDAFRMEAQRLTQAGMKAADVRKMAEKAGLGSAAAMYYGTAPKEEEPPKPEEARPYGPEFRVLDDDLKVTTTPRQRALEKEQREEDKIPPLVPTAGGTPMRVVNTPQARGMERQRLEAAAEAEAPFKAASERARAAERVQRATDRAAAQQASEAQRLQREQERSAARQARELRRTARTNDPVGFAANQDVEDARQREMRGQLRTMNRVIPKRGFGASLTDLITAAVPFTDALDRQLEALDLATREASEMRTVGTKRAQTRTARQTLIPQIREERARRGPMGPEGPRELELISQYREQIGVGKQQNAIMRESTARFKGFNAEATKGATVMKSFAAAAIGSIGSIATGALTFAVGAAIAQPMIEALGAVTEAALAPAVDKLTGFGATATRVTAEISKDVRARGGGAEAAVAAAGVSTGLGPSAFRQISQPIIDRAAVEAGNQALTEQLDLLHTQQNLQKDVQNQGFDKGLTGTISGIAGTEAFGQAPTSQILTSELARLPMLRSTQDQTRIDEIKNQMQGPVAGREMQALNAQLLELGDTAKQLSEEDLKQVSSTLALFNDNLEKAGSSARLVQDADGKIADASAKAADALDLPDLAETFRQQSIGITGVQTPEDLLKALEDISTAAPTPAPELLLLETRRERNNQFMAQEAQRQMQVGTVIPQTSALALAARPPTDTRSINLTGAGGSRDKLNKDLKETQGLYNQINKEIDAGVEASIDFVTNGADIAGLGENIGGLGAAAGAEFAASLKLVRDYGQQIADIEIGLETKQAAYQAAQFSYQIGIAKRNLEDAKGLAGQITDAGKENLGVLERQMFFLQRRAQMMQMELAQRQINFQTAVAGFTAPGITPEERNARVQEAKIEADFAQKQLDIQKKLFALQGRGFGISSARQVRDLEGQLGLLERGRVISLETAAAEKKIKALTILQEKENKKVTQFYEAAIARSNDIITLMGSVANAAKKSMSDVADAVLDEYEVFIDGLLDELDKAADVVFGTPDPAENLDRDEDAPQRHSGGNVMAGQSYWVGEQSRELFTPDVNGKITPGAMVGGGGMGGGGDVTNITIMVTGNNVSSEEELRKLEQRIVDAVEKAQGRKLSLLGGRAY